MSQDRVRHRVPPELIEDYERERALVKIDLSDLPDDMAPPDPIAEAEWILLDSDLNREMWADLDASVAFELHQRKGTKMLYVVEVSDEGSRVQIRASDGTCGVHAGRKIR